MKPQLQLHIPQPCHEDWNTMTPVDKGKFCGSCNKQVVDFSLMSDQQVLNYFSTATGKTCGRFAEDQLQRELVPTKIEKKKAWWIALMMPFLLLFDKTNAQKKNINIKQGETSEIKQAPRQQIMGKLKPTAIADTSFLLGKPAIKQELPLILGNTIMSLQDMVLSKPILINGRVTDKDNGEAIPFATITVKNKFTSLSADSAGQFHAQLTDLYSSISIEVSAIGYKTKQFEIHPDQAYDISITLQQKEIILPDVTVIAIADQYLTGRLGGAVCVITTVSRKELRDTAIRKAFRNEAFRAYPNPAPKGSMLHIAIKKAGEYSIQVLDNSSKLLLAEAFITESNNAVAPINIPSSFAAGIYYIRVIDERKKKSYVDKVIVQ